MIPSSRFKSAIFVFSLLGVGLLGVVVGRYVYLTKQRAPLSVGLSSTGISPTKSESAFPSTPATPVQPLAGGSGVFDRIAAEVSGVYEQAAPSVVRVRASDGPEITDCP